MSVTLTYSRAVTCRCSAAAQHNSVTLSVPAVESLPRALTCIPEGTATSSTHEGSDCRCDCPGCGGGHSALCSFGCGEQLSSRRAWKACWGQPLTSSNLVSSASASPGTTSKGPTRSRVGPFDVSSRLVVLIFVHTGSFPRLPRVASATFWAVLYRGIGQVAAQARRPRACRGVTRSHPMIRSMPRSGTWSSMSPAGSRKRRAS